MKQLLYTLIFLVLTSTMPLVAQDSVEDRLRRSYDLPLRWDNVEGRPEWVSGEEPKKSLLAARYEVTLEPGESVCVRVPPGEALRVLRKQDRWTEGALECAWSNGSGLLAFTTPDRDEDERSLLLASDHHQVMLVHLFRPEHLEEAITFSLYTSRRNPTMQLAGYRDLIDLGEGTVRLETSVESNPERWWPLQAADRRDLDLSGIGRYRLELRYRYPVGEATLPQAFHVDLRDRDDDRLIAHLDYATSHETAHLVYANGDAAVVSRVEQAAFDLPEDGTYALSLRSSAPVYARLLRLEDPEYLLPGLNGPREDPAEQAEALYDTNVVHGTWAIPETRLAEAMRYPEDVPAGVMETLALRLARDNTRREGGLAAANLLWRAGWRRPDFPDIAQRARELRGFRSYYRDVLPADGNHGPVFASHFPVRAIQKTGKYRPWLVLAEQHVDAGFGRFPRATFVPLPIDTPVTYLLPQRATFTTVRIAADRRGLEEPIDFHVRFDPQSTTRMRLLPEAELPPEDTKPSQGEAALQRLPGSTLDAATDVRGSAAETIDAAHFEWLQPAEMTRMHLHAPTSLTIAVQARASDVYALNEDAYHFFVEECGGPEAAFALLQRFLAEGSGNSTNLAARELCNHWEPLRRYMRSRTRQFTEAIAPPAGRTVDRALLTQAIQLLDRHEHFLGERLLRDVYLHATDPDLAQAAFARLLEHADQRLDPDTLLFYRSVDFGRAPSLEKAEALCRLLRRAGEPELALMLALVLPPQAENRDLRLACSYTMAWWQHFSQCVTEAADADDPLAARWRAQHTAWTGKLDQAHEILAEAGAEAAPWREYLEAGEDARTLIANGSEEGLRAWAQWEEADPGERVWQPAPAAWVQGSAGNLTVRALEREKYFRAYRAEPGRPLRLQLTAPGRLRIDCRPLHAHDAETPIEGWITVQLGTHVQDIPVTANYRSPGLVLTGDPTRVPGTLVSDTFASEAWNTAITIEPDTFPMLVRVLHEVRETPWPVLPQLEAKTAAWLFEGDTSAQRQANLEPSGHGAVVLVNQEAEVQTHALAAPFTHLNGQDVAALQTRLSRLAPQARPLDRPEQRARLQEMRDVLWSCEKEPEQLADALAFASLQREAYPNELELGRVATRILRRSNWEPVFSPARSAGLRKIEIAGFQPESPDLLTRLALLPALTLNEQIISGTDGLVTVLQNRSNNVIRLRVEHAGIPSLPAEAVRAEIQFNDEAPVEVRCAAGENPVHFRFDAPPGRSRIRVQVIDSRPNHYLKVGIEAERDPEILERRVPRIYQVATEEQPLVYRMAHTAWTRIDHYVNGRTHHHYQLVSGPSETLELAPPPGSTEALYRVHLLQADPQKPHESPPFILHEVEPVREAILSQTLPASAVYHRLRDDFMLGKQEDGTWSLGLSTHRRRPVEEDSAGGRDPEGFVQGDITHRIYRPDWRTYFRTLALYREREHGDPVTGLEHSLQYRPFDYPLTYTATAGGYLQSDDYHAYARLSLAQTRAWSPKGSHSPSLRLFGRRLSRDDAGAAPENVDQDVYTNYKRDHQAGWRIGDIVRYRPWRDQVLHAEAYYASNENFNPVDPDYAGYAFGAEQRFGCWQAGATWRGTHYFKDHDRENNQWRHRLALEASGDWWLPGQRRLEAGGALTHFVEEGENAYYLFIRLDLSAGRSLRDYRPGETPFRNLRNRDIPQDDNNRWYDEH